jgi:hypothetical protein
MRRLIAAVAALLTLLSPPPARAADGDAPPPAALPVTGVVLFSAGVGYYQREGAVTDTARVDLQFPEASVNDLLKSLVLSDRDGGRAGVVSYDNRNPLERTLKSFAIDLTANPGLGQLLQQARGERVEVRGREIPSVSGTVVGVEKARVPGDKGGTIEVEQLNLLTPNGLEGVPLYQVSRIRFLKPELEAEFRQALAVIAAGRDRQKKTVSMSFTGTGKRRVRVGYITESPMWKTSYRLQLEGKDKAQLQGWAVVENTTDDDWSKIRLVLVSGRPIAFKMDLYEPLFVPRPTVEPEVFASLRPPSYQGAMQGGLGTAGPAGRGGYGFAGGGEGQVPRELAKVPLPAPSPVAEPKVSGETTYDFKRAKNGNRDKGKDEKKVEYLRGALADPDGQRMEVAAGEGVVSAAAGVSLGDAFQYIIEDLVSLPRQKSALIPIANKPVEAARVSIYNRGVLEKHPLLGLRVKNATELHLMQGPVTVFDGPVYAGDARLPDVKPGESRLVSYAIDLGTEVEVKEPERPETLQSVKVANGLLTAAWKQRREHVYTVKNRSADKRLVLIEHPYDDSWKLVTPAKAAERSRDVYRFEVSAEPDKTATLEVVEEKVEARSQQLLSSADDAVGFFLKAGPTAPAVKAALEKALALRGKLRETQLAAEAEEQGLKGIEADQDRMRKNMERVPRDSDAYKRYLKKFDAQETEIEKRQAKLAELRAAAAEQQKAFEQYVATLAVE